MQDGREGACMVDGCAAAQREVVISRHGEIILSSSRCPKESHTALVTLRYVVSDGIKMTGIATQT